MENDPQLPEWAKNLLADPNSFPRPSGNLPDPPGYTSGGLSKKQATAKQAVAKPKLSSEEMDTLKMKKAWEIALAPAKSLPMNAVMMYMSGNSLQIFSIMMVWMLFKTPVTALTQVNNVFTRFESDGTRGKLWQVKGAYVLMNLLALALGIWKVNRMGLLP